MHTLSYQPTPAAPQAAAKAGSAHTLEAQRLRILRCTAQALLSSPGGLRFRPNSQPWLADLSLPRSAL